MVGVYDRQVAAAKRLIAAKGQAVTWRRLVDGSPTDPSKPWLPSAATTTDTAVSIVFLPMNRLGYESLTFMRDTEVPEGAYQGLMSGDVTFTPSIKDKVIRDGVQLEILNIDTLAPNGQAIIHTITFKK